jgi:type I restriction-modification system DNA methylase subunit
MESELANMNSTLWGGTRELSKKEQEVYTAQQTAISQIHSYLRLLDGGTVEWFDPRYMYGICGGFDVVIGNPPYVQLQKFARTQVQKDLENVWYKTFEKAGDLYCIFYERGIQLSKKNTGILSYITSNKWMRAGYGKSLREYFTSLEPLILIDCGPGIFESATVDTNILILRNRYNKESV